MKKNKSLKPSFITKTKNKTPLQEIEAFEAPPQKVIKVNQNTLTAVKRPQGPSKLLEIQKQVKERRPEDMPPPK